MPEQPMLKSLERTLIKHSLADLLESALREWEVTGYSEDEKQESQCLCGKTHIKYCFTIENKRNGEVLSPIGSECMKNFQHAAFNTQMDILKKQYKEHKKLVKRITALDSGIDEIAYPGITVESLLKESFTSEDIWLLEEHKIMLPTSWKNGDLVAYANFLDKMLKKVHKYGAWGLTPHQRYRLVYLLKKSIFPGLNKFIEENNNGK